MTENEELALEVEELNTALASWMRENDELRAERDDDTRFVLTILNGQHNTLGAALAALSRRWESRLIELDRADAGAGAASADGSTP